MVNFVSPNILNTKQHFTHHFIIPIQKGLHIDSNQTDIIKYQQRIYILQQILKNIVLRRNGDLLIDSLPKRNEYIIHIKMSKLQSILYNYFLQYIHNISSINTLSAYHDLKLLLNHPYILKKHIQLYPNIRYNWILPYLDMINNQIEHSGKMILLLQMLQYFRSIGDRVVVFSKSIETL
jgi:SNF2 family DNA or RNA helicase